MDLPRSGRPNIPDEISTDAIMEILQEKPKSTSNQISAATELSQSTVLRRIKCDIGMHSYKIQIHQELSEDDFDRRVEMAQIMLPILQDPGNKGIIFFSDEATFYLSGRVHKQNCRIWDMKSQVKFIKNHYIVQK